MEEESRKTGAGRREWGIDKRGAGRGEKEERCGRNEWKRGLGRRELEDRSGKTGVGRREWEDRSGKRGVGRSWTLAEFKFVFLLFDKNNNKCFKRSTDQQTRILVND